MRVLEPRELEQRREDRAKKHKVLKHRHRILPLLFGAITVYAVVVMLIPAPNLKIQAEPLKVPNVTSVNMAWPSYGQAAIGAVGYGLLAQNGAQKPLPIASVAKVLTAIAVLKVRPIQPGSHGDTITITAADVATYKRYLADDQSVVKVEAGEQISEYQALQALLLPSANNMADVLVRWAFGSTENYLAFVNPFTKTLGFKNTSIDDASGFSPKTTSTSTDLAKMGEIAMNQPVIAEIISQPEAIVPVAGVVYNVNKLVGHEGIVGIKTGNTDEAGGCYLFSARRKISGGHDITVVGAIMGAADLSQAIKDALPLLDTAFKNFKVVMPIPNDGVVGNIVQSHGRAIPIKAAANTALVAWAGQDLHSEFLHVDSRTSVRSGDVIGTITLMSADMTSHLPVTADGSIASHSPLWRLRHAAGYL